MTLPPRQKTARRQAICIKIYCPVSSDTLKAMLDGSIDALERDEVASQILSVIRSADGLGNFGLYRGVTEIGTGWESFAPSANAVPTLGQTGVTTRSPTVILTTYAPVDADIDEALTAIMLAHPWEVPVIELSTVELLIR